jgi:hypothetical protein
MKIRRRDFIHRLAVMLTGAALPGRGFAAHKAAPASLPMRGWLGYLDDPSGARHLGTMCLRDGAVEQSPVALEAKLETTLGRPPNSMVEARWRFRMVVEREFAARNWLQVEGWWLSRTEARLYALASLAH